MGRITKEQSWEILKCVIAETALVSWFDTCNRTINLNYFDFLQFGKPRGIAVRVKKLKVSSNKFWTWKEKRWHEKLSVSMNASMVRYHNKNNESFYWELQRSHNVISWRFCSDKVVRRCSKQGAEIMKTVHLYSLSLIIWWLTLNMLRSYHRERRNS